MTFSTGVLFILLYTWILLNQKPKNLWNNRLIRVSNLVRYQSNPLYQRIFGIFGLIFFGSGVLVDFMNMDYSKILYSVLVSIIITVYVSASIIMSIYLWNLILRWLLPPDLYLINTLISAYDLAYTGKASEWRSFTFRRKIALLLNEAASILEGPMLRIIVGGRGSKAGVVAHLNLNAIASGLRQKLSWLATPKADTREHLARAIGEIIIVAVTGNLDRLLASEGRSFCEVYVSWKDRLIAAGRWAIVALGPAAAALIVWYSVTDPGTRLLAAQFAVLSFVYATFSATSPKGDDRLGSIVATGSNMFGWGKSKI